MKSHNLKITTIVSFIITFVLIAVVMMGVSMAPPVVQAQQANESLNAMPRTIRVVGEGTVSAEPDVAEANIGVQVSEPTVEAATEQAAATMDAVLAALQAQGIAEADIQTSGFNIFMDTQPQPIDAQAQTSETESYRVSNNVRVTIRNLDQVSPVLDAAIEAGANNIFGVNFHLSQTDQRESDARQQAMDNAQAKAQELADLASVDLGSIISVSEVVGGSSIPIGTSISAADSLAGRGGAGPISPGELEVRTQLEVVYGIE